MGSGAAFGFGVGVGFGVALGSRVAVGFGVGCSVRVGVGTGVGCWVGGRVATGTDADPSEGAVASLLQAANNRRPDRVRQATATRRLTDKLGSYYFVFTQKIKHVGRLDLLEEAQFSVVTAVEYFSDVAPGKKERPQKFF